MRTSRSTSTSGRPGHRPKERQEQEGEHRREESREDGMAIAEKVATDSPASSPPQRDEGEADRPFARETDKVHPRLARPPALPGVRDPDDEPQQDRKMHC